MDPYRYFGRRDLSRYSAAFKPELYYPYSLPDPQLFLAKTERSVLEAVHRSSHLPRPYVDNRERIYRQLHQRPPLDHHHQPITHRRSPRVSPVRPHSSKLRSPSPYFHRDGILPYTNRSPYRDMSPVRRLSPTRYKDNFPLYRRISADDRELSPARRSVSPKRRVGPFPYVDSINRRSSVESPVYSPSLSPHPSHKFRKQRSSSSSRRSTSRSPVSHHTHSKHKKKSRHKTHRKCTELEGDKLEIKLTTVDGYEDISHESDADNDSVSNDAASQSYTSSQNKKPSGEDAEDNLRSSPKDEVCNGDASTSVVIKNFKLIQDPVVTKGVPKIVRFDGIVPGGPPLMVSDPRPPVTGGVGEEEPIELTVPHFKIDRNFIGNPLPVEVTFFNLNNNIDKTFFEDMVLKFGEVEELCIYYHPYTNRHLGIARVIFVEVESAKECVQKLNGLTVMGRVLKVFHDPLGAAISEKYLKEASCEITTSAGELLPALKRSTGDVSKKVQISVDKNVSTPSSLLSENSKSETVNSDLSSASSGYGSASTSSASDPRVVKDSKPKSSMLSGISPVAGTPTLSPAVASLDTKIESEEEKLGVQKTSTEVDLDTRIEMILDDKLEKQLLTFGAVGDKIPLPPPPPEAPLPPLPPPLPPPPDEPPVVSLHLRGKSRNGDLHGSDEDKMSISSLSPHYERVPQLPRVTADLTGYSHIPPPPPTQPPPLPTQLPPPPPYPPISHPLIPHYGSQMYGHLQPISSLVPPPLASQLPPLHLPPPSVPPPPLSMGYVPNYYSGETTQMYDNHYWNQHQLYMCNVPPPSPPYNKGPKEEQKVEYNNRYRRKGRYSRSRWNRKANSHVKTVDDIVDTLTAEMRYILKRDVNKKMLENTAFTILDLWWEEREKVRNSSYYSNVKNHHNEEKSEVGSNSATNLSQILESGQDGLESLALSGLGLGFRASIPKMPSFKRRKPEPQRKSSHYEGHASDQEEFVQHSDTETLDEDTDDERTKYLQRQKLLDKLEQEASSDSESLFSSSSSSVSDASSDVEEEEEAVEEHVKLSPKYVKARSDLEEFDYDDICIIRSRTPSERGTPIPDELSSFGFECDEPCDDSVIMEERLPVEEERKRGEGDRDQSAESCSDLEDYDLSLAERMARKRKMLYEGSSRKLLKLSEDEDEEMVEKQVQMEATEDEEEQKLLNSGMKRRRRVIDEDEKMDDYDNEEGSENRYDKLYSVIDADHSYCLPWSTSQDNYTALQSVSYNDHDYVSSAPEIKSYNDHIPKREPLKERNYVDWIPARKPEDYYKKPQYVSEVTFKNRSMEEEFEIMFEFLTSGIDEEDIRYIKRQHEVLLTDERCVYWQYETNWIDHPSTYCKPHKEIEEGVRVHKTGSARTEGYYKIDSRQKAKHKVQHVLAQSWPEEAASEERLRAKMVSISREARSNQRRLLTAYGGTSDSDLLKFNILKFRKKQLKFAKSSIHDWGLFAMESIAADEMVIEYVGQMVRPVVADLRERQYEATGIGSSYLFRIDLESIIDATKCGNLARFINHSCNPNCYAKIITIDGQKKIVIYSKQQIAINEEITYDYKFPIEENKIPCLCGAPTCRGTLN